MYNMYVTKYNTYVLYISAGVRALVLLQGAAGMSRDIIRKGILYICKVILYIRARLRALVLLQDAAGMSRDIIHTQEIIYEYTSIQVLYIRAP